METMNEAIKERHEGKVEVSSTRRGRRPAQERSDTDENASPRYLAIVIGPLPPPVHGVTVAIERVLAAKLPQDFALVHLDTSDHRDVSSVGRHDLRNYWLALTSYAGLVLLCWRHRPEIVYVPISQSFVGYVRDSIYFVLARLLGRARVVVHLHGGHLDGLYESCNRVEKWFMDATMRIPSRAIVLSEVFRPIFRRWFPDGAIDVVPNGAVAVVDAPAAKLARSRLDGDSPWTITFMSGLTRTKGIYEFVDAAVDCVKQRDNLNFVVAGEWWDDDPDLRRRTLERVGEVDSGRIRLVGLVRGEAKAELLRQTDVLVLPSYYPFEGQPTVIIEAMAAATPVVATRHAAIPDMVVDGETGILVPKQDAQALADALLQITRSRSRWYEMSVASLKRFDERYTTELSNELLLDSFRRAVRDAERSSR
jgi:glycosyltransferase involved in cell wall biosynthesis